MIGPLVSSHIRWLVRTRDVLATLMLIAGTVALAALLALHDADQRALAASGVLWIVLPVGGLLATARALSAEHGTGGLRGLLLAPVDRRDLFLARCLSLSIIVAAMVALTWAIVATLFPDLSGTRDPRLALPLLVGAAGLGTLGALTGWASLSARAGELVAPVVGLPAAAPLIVAGLHATEAILAGQAGWQASLTFATGYAVAVGALSYIVSPHVMEVP